MPRPYSSQNSHIIRKLDLHSAGFRFRCMRYNTSKKKTKSYAEKWNTSQKKTSWINIAVQPKFLHVYHLLRHEALILSSEVLKKHKKLKNATPLLVTSNFNIWCLSAHPVIFGSVFFNHPLKKTKKKWVHLAIDSNFHSQACYPKKSCCLPGNFTMSPCRQKKMCFLFRQRRISSNYISFSDSLNLLSWMDWIEQFEPYFLLSIMNRNNILQSSPPKKWRFIW